MINIDDFCLLVKKYNDLNFNNIKVTLEYNKRLGKQNSVINIDNCINIHYVHYIQDETYDTPSVKPGINNVDIFYKDIIEYTKAKWKSRINKLYNCNETPQFIYSFNYQYLNIDDNEYISRFNKLIKLSKINKIYIIANDCEISQSMKIHESDNLKILLLSDDECTLYKNEHISKINTFIKNN